MSCIPLVWIRIVPLKVITFIWIVFQDRIPTFTTLSIRRVKISSSDCLICSGNMETTDYLLADCSFFHEVISWIFKWCDILDHMFSYVVVFINFASSWVHCPKKRKLLLAIIYGTFWCVWRENNEKVFKKMSCTQRKQQIT